MRGRAIPLSAARRLVVEHCRLSQGVPKTTLAGRLDVGALVAARAAAAAGRPPWTAVFAKAMALAAVAVPELRRSYVKLPWPHLYEVPASVAAVVVERDLGGEPALFYARVRAPEATPLAAVAARIREAKEAPVGAVKDFRTALAVARLPQPLRRWAFWLGRNLGRQMPNHLGTFGVSALGDRGVSFIAPVSHWSGFLAYGPIGADGGVELFFTFDHRVLDGAAAARAFHALGAALRGPVLEDLRALAAAGAAPRADA
jgi:hypothetical protein